MVQRLLIANRKVPVPESAVPESLESACFFAGIGGWPYAIELAEWPKDLPASTGSCPCQPFSVAGTNKATTDERHIWAQWLRLSEVCRPTIVFGEQVASPAGREWYTGGSDQFEDLGYQVGAADLCLSRRVLAGGEKELNDYFTFLRGGCRKDPLELLKGAGVDMTCCEPVATTLKRFGDLSEELEQRS